MLRAGVYLIGDLRLGGDLRLAGDRLSGGRGGLVSQSKDIFFQVRSLLKNVPDLPACPLPWLLNNWTFSWTTVVWRSLRLLESSFLGTLSQSTSNMPLEKDISNNVQLDSRTSIIWCRCCRQIQILPEHQHAFQTCRLAFPAPLELVLVIGILASQVTNFSDSDQQIFYLLPLSKASPILLQNFLLYSPNPPQ